jgi:hypothetical protein
MASRQRQMESGPDLLRKHDKMRAFYLVPLCCAVKKREEAVEGCGSPRPRQACSETISTLSPVSSFVPLVRFLSRHSSFPPIRLGCEKAVLDMSGLGEQCVRRCAR